MTKTYKIYWIFDAATDTDMMTQGYIGCTTQSVAKRFNSHVQSTHSGQVGTASNTKRHMNQFIKNCIDPQYVEICRTTDEDIASKIERLLRPEPGIGANKHRGGKRNGVQRPIVCITEDGSKIEYVSQSEAARDGFNTGGIHNILTNGGKFTSHKKYGKCSFTYKA